MKDESQSPRSQIHNDLQAALSPIHESFPAALTLDRLFLDAFMTRSTETVE